VAFYLVKAGGTAIGNGGRHDPLPHTDFASYATSEYYDSISLANSVPSLHPNENDVILVSDTHNLTAASFSVFSFAVTKGRSIRVRCVQDGNLNVLSSGAVETSTVITNDIIFDGAWDLSGITLIGARDFKPNSNSWVTIRDGGIGLTSTTRLISLTNPNVLLELINSDVSYLDN